MIRTESVKRLPIRVSLKKVVFKQHIELLTDENIF